MKKFWIILLLGLTACGAPSTTSPLNTRDDLTGQPTVLVWAATYCPHCQDFVPQVKTEVADRFPQVRVLINVVDHQRFNSGLTEIDNANLDFDAITNTTCKYVPSWVVLDVQNQVIDSSCGASQSLEKLVTAVKKVN